MSILASLDDAVQSDRGALVAELLQLRPIGIDDWSAVRHVHTSAFRTLVGPRVAARFVDEFLSFIETPEYAERLSGSDLVGAWLDGQLAGTAGWRPAGGHVARIEGLFVQPLFTFMGLGSLLLAHVEARARRAGYSTFTAEVTAASVPFLARSGYDLYAHGAGISDGVDDMPVFVMRKREAAATAMRAKGFGGHVPQTADADAGILLRGAPNQQALVVEE